MAGGSDKSIETGIEEEFIISKKLVWQQYSVKKETVMYVIQTFCKHSKNAATGQLLAASEAKVSIQSVGHRLKDYFTVFHWVQTAVITPVSKFQQLKTDKT